jgi:hypothetical protein
MSKLPSTKGHSVFINSTMDFMLLSFGSFSEKENANAEKQINDISKKQSILFISDFPLCVRFSLNLKFY